MQHKNLINIENWTYCRYMQGTFLAMITFGADAETLKEDRLDYFVTVLEDEEKEVFQQQFTHLADACLFINANYGDWAFEDQTRAKEGCSSCAAH